MTTREPLNPARSTIRRAYIPKPGVLTAMPHYATLLRAAKTVGWPRMYATDLTFHDRKTLTRVAPSTPFLWVLRDCGTCLYVVDNEPIDGAGHYAWDIPKICSRVFGDDHCRWYLWDGFTLLEFSTADDLTDAAKTMARERREPCGGTFYNGPEKRFARCDRCGAISYEANEGDRHV